LEKKNHVEGVLSQKRSIIVGRKHLNLIGEKIIPSDKIISNLKLVPKSVFGNTLEAIIGAIYIDKGLKATKLFIKEYIYKSEYLNSLSDIDFKSQLLTRSQKERFNIEYRLERKEGLEHAKFFLVSVFINGKKICRSKGIFN
jgi:ribonuclease-3